MSKHRGRTYSDHEVDVFVGVEQLEEGEQMVQSVFDQVLAAHQHFVKPNLGSTWISGYVLNTYLQLYKISSVYILCSVQLEINFSIYRVLFLRFEQRN